MKTYKNFRIIALFCLFAAVLPCFLQTSVLAKSDTPNISGVRQAYLYNLENDKIIYTKGSDSEVISPASTVKIMSGLLAIKRLQDRQEEYVTISTDMLSGVEGFTVKLKAGDTLKIKDLLYGLICGGGNDAAMVLARICSGSVAAFVAEMNAEAKALGMSKTVYKNPTGIDEQGMVTTLKDTVILSKAAIESSPFVEMSSIPEYKYIEGASNEEKTIANRNALISNYSAIGYKNKHVKGLNSGMTVNGGYCVSAYATNGNDRYLCVIMGGEKTTNGKISSYTAANDLLNFAINNFEYKKIASKGDVITTIPVDLALPTNGYDTVTASCVLERDIYAYAPKNIDYDKELDYKIFLHNEILSAPVKPNTVVGGVEIYFGDELLASSRLITDSSVTESRLLVILQKMRDVILSRTAILFVIILAVLLCLYFYITVWRKKIKRKRAIVRDIKNRSAELNNKP